MTKQKSTKRALLMSALALLMCVSMLIGSTFAWFTDTATTGVNTIQSGNLDMVVTHTNSRVTDQVIDNATNLFVAVDGQAILWEPGASATETFTVKNNGNLAFKYQFKVNVEEPEDASVKLSDVLTVKVNDQTPAKLDTFMTSGVLNTNGASDTIKVTIMWTPSANDNTYNVAGGLTINLGISVVATQMTYEKDGIDDQYDANATYPLHSSTEKPIVSYVGTAQDLKDALSTLATEGSVVLTKDIDLTDTDWDVTMPWSGSATTITIDGQGHTIKGLNTTGQKGGLLGKLSTNGNVIIKDLNFENVTLTGEAGDGEDAGGALIGWYENHGGTVTISNVHVKNVNISNFKYSGGLIGYASTEGITVENCSVDGTTVDSINHAGGLVGYMQVANSSTAFNGIKNCEIKNLAVKTTNSTKGREGAVVGTLQAGCSINGVELTDVTVMGVDATANDAVGAVNNGVVENIVISN